MLSLEEIFKGHPLSKHDTPLRRVLFEEDDGDNRWCIYERIPEGLDDKFHLLHRCKVGTYAVYLGPQLIGADNQPRCRECYAVPSEGIVGLIRLHKWGMGDEHNANRV